MFDISDPAELKTLGTKVLTGFDHSPAMFSYKSVLADTEENLIGFSVVNYDGGMSGYLLFAWENGEFRRLLSVELPGVCQCGSLPRDLRRKQILCRKRRGSSRVWQGRRI